MLNFRYENLWLIKLPIVRIKFKMMNAETSSHGIRMLCFNLSCLQ